MDNHYPPDPGNGRICPPSYLVDELVGGDLMELIEKVKHGLQYTIEMFLFDPGTGYTKDPDDLNAADRITFDACIGAIDLLKEQEAVVRCKDCSFNKTCTNRPSRAMNNPNWFCAGGKRKDGDGQ